MDGLLGCTSRSQPACRPVQRKRLLASVQDRAGLRVASWVCMREAGRHAPMAREASHGTCGLRDAPQRCARPRPARCEADQPAARPLAGWAATGRVGHQPGAVCRGRDGGGAQEEHELERCASGLIADGAPRHWRLRALARGRGAFQGLTVRPAPRDL